MNFTLKKKDSEETKQLEKQKYYNKINKKNFHVINSIKENKLNQILLKNNITITNNIKNVINHNNNNNESIINIINNNVRNNKLNILEFDNNNILPNNINLIQKITNV
jgi:hypothetical protein